jgi:ATP-dependent DNA helicase RecG
VLAGDQAFLICPFIEPSETLEAVRSAKKEYEALQGVFPRLKLGLLHGRQSAKERDTILESFRASKIDLLIATPIVEVGIDIPNATIILIEAADRFGLASLHQLRGRVARSEKPSFCLLFTETEEPRALARLKNLEKLNNGFDLAEADLAYRGPGQVFGTLQHGLPDLKIATLADQKLVSTVRTIAQALLKKNPIQAKKFLQTSPYHENLVVWHLD